MAFFKAPNHFLRETSLLLIGLQMLEQTGHSSASLLFNNMNMTQGQISFY